MFLRYQIALVAIAMSFTNVIFANSLSCDQEKFALSLDVDQLFEDTQRVDDHFIEIQNNRSCEGYDLVYSEYNEVAEYYLEIQENYYRLKKFDCGERFELDILELYNRATDIEFSTQIMRHQTITEKRKLGCFQDDEKRAVE
jgi:hypothetical protein